ncbi:MAG: hypothetical protein V3W09_04335 [Nitrososphaerales archaeon]
MAITHNSSARQFAVTAAADEVTVDLIIKSVRWVAEAGVAGNNISIVDPQNTGETLWESVVSGANYVEAQLSETRWANGFRVSVLDSGTLYINYM